jgi:hypothetical protein
VSQAVVRSIDAWFITSAVQSTVASCSSAAIRPG